MQGLHVIVQLDDGKTVPVHLGPAWYVERQGFAMSPDDALDITGSRVVVDGSAAVIARKIVKGDQEIVLRDESGAPEWSRGRRRGP
jgi:hypothetical protein